MQILVAGAAPVLDLAGPGGERTIVSVGVGGSDHGESHPPSREVHRHAQHWLLNWRSLHCHPTFGGNTPASTPCHFVSAGLFDKEVDRDGVGDRSIDGRKAGPSGLWWSQCSARSRIV